MNLQNAIQSLLFKLDNEFQPSLSSTIDITTYTEKIVNNAKIIAIVEKGELNAFIAFYCNNKLDKLSYLSMLAVKQENRGMGLAQNLINSAIQILKKEKFLKFRLEVYKTNINAIKLYQHNNFIIIQELDFSYIMELKIK